MTIPPKFRSMKIPTIGQLSFGLIICFCLGCIGAFHHLPSASALPLASLERLAQATSEMSANQEQVVVLPITTTQVPSDLLSNARTIAQNTVNQQFQTQAQLMHLTLHIVAERSGQEVPLLTLRLSRQQWTAGEFDRQFQDAGIAASLLLEEGDRSTIQATTNATPLKRRGRGFRNRRIILEQQEN